MLQSMGSQRVGHELATERHQQIGSQQAFKSYQRLMRVRDGSDDNGDHESYVISYLKTGMST